jgi:hypothetical protein
MGDIPGLFAGDVLADMAKLWEATDRPVVKVATRNRARCENDLPSGEPLHSYGKSPCFY